MEAFTIGMTMLVLALIYKLMQTMINIVVAVVAALALFAIGWGVYKRRKTRRYKHEQTN